MKHNPAAAAREAKTKADAARKVRDAAESEAAQIQSRQQAARQHAEKAALVNFERKSSLQRGKQQKIDAERASFKAARLVELKAEEDIRAAEKRREEAAAVQNMVYMPPLCPQLLQPYLAHLGILFRAPQRPYLSWSSPPLAHWLK